MQRVLARVRLPGHEPRPAEVEVAARTLPSRAVRALALAALWPATTLLAILIPPHGEPFFLALFGGGYLVYREWNTRYVIRHLRAACPRCESDLRIRRAQRLGPSLEVPCYGCHFTPVLELGGGAGDDGPCRPRTPDDAPSSRGA